MRHLFTFTCLFLFCASGKAQIPHEWYECCQIECRQIECRQILKSDARDTRDTRDTRAAHEITDLKLVASPAKRKLFDTTISERGWVARVAYNRQETTNWGEFGFGRMARLQHYDNFGKGTTAAAASFTFGADIGYDTSFIGAPKLSVEFSSIVFGGRVSYGYYMQDGNSSGVIGLEGGLNFVSVFFIYAGYNFVKGNSDTPVITEGSKFSIGFNYPIGMRRVPPPKSSSHL